MIGTRKSLQLEEGQTVTIRLVHPAGCPWRTGTVTVGKRGRWQIDGTGYEYAGPEKVEVAR